MVEYIDKQTAIAEIKRIYCTDCSSYNGVKCRACDFASAMDVLEDAPKADGSPGAARLVDAVEVVRCKDCFWNDRDGRCMNPKCGKSWYGCPVPDEHFCSYGEKREVE